MYASYDYLIYQFLSVCFVTYSIVYSSYSSFIAAHDVDIHTDSRYTETYYDWSI